MASSYGGKRNIIYFFPERQLQEEEAEPGPRDTKWVGPGGFLNKNKKGNEDEEADEVGQPQDELEQDDGSGRVGWGGGQLG